MLVHNLSFAGGAGTLPPSWGAAGACAALSVLEVWGSPLTGTLPPSWGEPNSFSALEQLVLGGRNHVITTWLEYASSN
jgi:hypothetical protein